MNADKSAILCLDFFLREDGSFGFDEFRRNDGQDWTPTLPDVYSTDKFASEAEARAEARAAIPWFSSWAYHLDRPPLAKGLKFPTERAHPLPALPPVGATGLRTVPHVEEAEAFVNTVAVMGFISNYAGEGFAC